MTYLEVVSKIKELVDQHPQLAQFGYGALSDIRVNQTATEKKDAYVSQAVDYPYIFLVPGVHQTGGNADTYNFDMIALDLLPIKEIEMDGLPNYLRIQSDAVLYLKDLLAQLVYSTDPLWDIKAQGTITPFKEKFDDWVAGATLKLSITVPGGLNKCVVPYQVPN
jgi:hypothetical protein